MFFAHWARVKRSATLPASSRFRALRAHAEGLHVHLRPSAEIGRALEGARERDAGADAFLERGGARRVVAAERYAPDSGAQGVDVGASLEEIEHRFRGLLVFRAEREVVLGSPWPGPSKDKVASPRFRNRFS